ncbi:hypothetical protein HOLleu_10280 [Holothuria leucospilota]|uniref:Uncharacterized protein n=1 Tax=Holothuria leucospilota TaxID=206669 RepID=A0A9Q1HFK9_HOLLE|nr:hypothetical protein HOLleu_10280 [Holothuria leucospilota]
MKNPVPTPIEFKYALRIITVVQFLKTSHASNYQEDSSEFLADFFDQTPLPSQEGPDLEDIQLNANQSVEDLSNAEMNSLYYLVGYCISRICMNDKYREKCISSIRGASATSGSSSRLTEMKNYKEGCLAHPTEDKLQSRCSGNATCQARSRHSSRISYIKHPFSRLQMASNRSCFLDISLIVSRSFAGK